MPQLTKGGKFVYGKSFIRDDLSVRIPPQAVSEYEMASEDRVYLMTGCKRTGGFSVTRKGLLAPSKIGNILRDIPALDQYALPQGAFAPYKGRAYCWSDMTEGGFVRLTPAVLERLQLTVGMELLVIRSSDIAFTMGAKGPLLERAGAYPGEIQVF